MYYIVMGQIYLDYQYQLIQIQFMKSPLSDRTGNEWDTAGKERAQRERVTLGFQLSTIKEKNLELEAKMKLLDTKYVEMEKELISLKEENLSLHQHNTRLVTQLESMNQELKSAKQPKPKHFDNQNLIAKVKILQDSLDRQTKQSIHVVREKQMRLPQLRLINNIQNYQINNESFKTSGEDQSGMQQCHMRKERQKRWREMVSNYEMTMSQKGQMEEECQFLLIEMEKLKEYINELQSINHLLKQEVLECKVRMNCHSKTTETEEDERLSTEIEIELLTESTNQYYNLLESLISAGHSKESTLKMKQILNLQIQQLNESKSRIEINNHLEQLEYIYKQENQSSQYQQQDLIQRRKQIQQFRNKLFESKQRLEDFDTEKQTFLFELTTILRHQEKMVTYSLELERKVKSHEDRETLRNHHPEEISFKRPVGHSDHGFRRTTVERFQDSQQRFEQNSSKSRISFYQNNEAEEILKDVANKDKEMVERALKSERHLCS